MAVDFILDPRTRDLKLTDSGALAYHNEPESIAQNFARRLTTPPTGYARVLRNDKQVVLTGSTYGSKFSNLLSSSVKEISANLNLVHQASQADGRLEVLDVKIVNFLDSNNKVILNSLGLDITYQVRNQNIPYSTTVIL